MEVTCIARRPRTLRPVTRPTLIPCRWRVDYQLIRTTVVTRLKTPGVARNLRNALGGSQREESLRLRYCYAVQSAWRTRTPRNTSDLLAVSVMCGVRKRFG